MVVNKMEKYARFQSLGYKKINIWTKINKVFFKNGVDITATYMQ